MEANKAAQAIIAELTLTKQIKRQGQKYTIAEYQRGRQVGTGGFSFVYQVRQYASAIQQADIGTIFVAKQTPITNRQNEEMVVAKQMPINKRQNEEMFQNERAVLKTIKSLDIQNYFATIHDQWRDEKCYYIILERYRMGSLFQLHKWYQRYNKPLKKQEIIYFIYQILKALEILHYSGITHGDIKLQNIMLDDDLNIKIIDFGLARIKGLNKKQNSEKRKGTLYYMAPQVLNRQINNYSQKIDVWAAGILLYYLMFSKFPYVVAQSEKMDFDKACNRLRQQIEQNNDIFSAGNQIIQKNDYNELVVLTKVLLEKDLSRRKSVNEILHMKEFQSIWHIVQGMEEKAEQQKTNYIPTQRTNKIRKSLYNDNRLYFNSRLIDSTKWQKQIAPKCIQLPPQLLFLRDKRKVRVIDVVYLKKFGFFFLLSNGSIFAYFNDNKIVKFQKQFLTSTIEIPAIYSEFQQSRLRQQQIMQDRQQQKPKIDKNKQKILMYVRATYFIQKINATSLIDQKQNKNCLLQKQQCKVQKVFFHENSLFVRLSNQTLQVFFPRSAKSEKTQMPKSQELFFNRCVILNNNQKNKNQIIYKKDEQIVEYQNYDAAAQKGSACHKYIDYIKNIFELILDNSQISLQYYGLKRAAKAK